MFSASSFFRVTDHAAAVYNFLSPREIAYCEVAFVYSRIKKHTNRSKRLARFFRYDYHTNDNHRITVAHKENNQFVFLHDEKPLLPSRHRLALPFWLWASDPDRYSWISALHSVDYIDYHLRTAINIKSIELDFSDKPYIAPGSLPSSLQRLYLGSAFRGVISPGSLPSKLLSLEAFHANRSPGVYDRTGDAAALNLQDVLPNTLRTLSFIDRCTWPLKMNTKLPPYLERLIFGTWFDDYIPRGLLPVSLTHLEISGAGYARIIKNEVDITSLRVLRLTSSAKTFKGGFPLGFFPSSLATLELPNSYDDKLCIGVLPPSLKSITFGHSFNQPLEVGVFPPGIERIVFGAAFNQPLRPGLFPNGVRELVFSERIIKTLMELPLDNVFPPSLAVVRCLDEEVTD